MLEHCKAELVNIDNFHKEYNNSETKILRNLIKGLSRLVKRNKA